MAIILCVVPLSETFKKAIESDIQREAEYMSLAAVKPKGPIAALRFLARQRTDAVYVAFEDTQEMIMMPIICVISLFIRSPRRFIIRPDRKISELSGVDLSKAILNV